MIRALVTLFVQERYRPRPSRRHARPSGQPRRSWMPDGRDIPAATLPVFDDVVPVLATQQTRQLRGEFEGDLWRAVRANAGNEERTGAEAFCFLFQRPHRRRRAARTVAS